MVAAWQKGLRVVRLHTGDPSIYGAIREQMVRLEAASIPCEVIPGVSSAFAAAASLKAELTLPEVAQTVIITTPGPAVTVTQPAQTIQPAETPTYVWAIVGIGAVLVIAIIVLIIRTRRVA